MIVEYEKQARHLRAWREHFGMSEKDVSARFGWLVSHYKKFEAGHIEMGWDVARDVSDMYGTDAWDMLNYLPNDKRKVYKPRVLKPRALPERDLLQSLFSYDPDTGVFLYKAADFSLFSSGRSFDAHHKKIGQRADRPSPNGYRFLTVNKQNFGAHRMAALFANGPFDAWLEVDHLNGSRGDNRLANIRVVTSAQNSRNVPQRHNQTGFLGVTKILGRVGGYRATCSSDGITYSMGPFSTPESASEALEKLKDKMDLGFGPMHKVA